MMKRNPVQVQDEDEDKDWPQSGGYRLSWHEFGRAQLQ